jgi:hypothetical protein
MPSGAVASELAKEGKKKTILRDLDRAISLLTGKIFLLGAGSCHVLVSDL